MQDHSVAQTGPFSDDAASDDGASHLSASTIRLPLSASRFIDRTSQQRRSRHDRPGALRSLEPRQIELQNHLQELINAQADGLLRGLGHRPESGRRTPDGSLSVPQAVNHQAVVPVRQPKQRQMKLADSRRAIHDTMRELQYLKTQEKAALGADAERHRDDLQKIDDWDRKRQALRQGAEDVQNNSDHTRIDALNEEGRALQEQITAMQTQLEELRSQHRAVRAELSNINNATQSKLSSYNSSLRLLEEQVQAFVTQPPQTRGSSASNYEALPAQRRTLDMVAEHLHAEESALRGQLDGVAAEELALDEGAQLWQQTVECVSGFESKLREYIRSARSQSVPPADQPMDQSASKSPGDAIGLLAAMDDTLLFLEKTHQHAQGRGWNLLVCCVGAELEAFRQGHELLRAALAPDGIDGEQGQRSPVEELRGDFAEVAVTPADSSEGSEKSVTVFSTPHRRARVDDGPEPDLLIAEDDRSDAS